MLLIASGLLVLILLAVALLTPALPALVMRVVGFETLRGTNAPISNDAIATLANKVAGSYVTFVTQDFGRLDLPQTTNLEITAGDDASGARVLQVGFKETDMRELCLQLTEFCVDRGNPIRRATFSIAGGFITISAEAFIDVIGSWQAIDIHLAVDEADHLSIDSISLAGLRYKLPANTLGNRIREMQSTITRILKQLQAESSGDVFSFARFDLSDNRLVATFRRG